jgi:hypothetical protein
LCLIAFYWLLATPQVRGSGRGCGPAESRGYVALFTIAVRRLGGPRICITRGDRGENPWRDGRSPDGAGRSLRIGSRAAHFAHQLCSRINCAIPPVHSPSGGRRRGRRGSARRPGRRRRPRGAGSSGPSPRVSFHWHLGCKSAEKVLRSWLSDIPVSLCL